MRTWLTAAAANAMLAAAALPSSATQAAGMAKTAEGKQLEDAQLLHCAAEQQQQQQQQQQRTYAPEISWDPEVQVCAAFVVPAQSSFRTQEACYGPGPQAACACLTLPGHAGRAACSCRLRHISNVQCLIATLPL